MVIRQENERQAEQNEKERNDCDKHSTHTTFVNKHQRKVQNLTDLVRNPD